MATMNLSICDLCNAIRKDGLPFRLAIKEKGAKGGATVKAEICQGCFDDLSSRIQSEISFDKINKSAPTQPRQEVVCGTIGVIEDGITIAPSTMDYSSKANKLTNVCSHDNTSYEPPNIICKDCGHSWVA